MAMVLVGVTLVGTASMSTNIKNGDYGDLIIPSSKGMNRTLTGKALLSAKLGLVILVSPLVAMISAALLEFL